MDSNTIALFKSKKTDDWRTPPDLYNELNKEFNFDFDPSPFQSTFDGLIVNWGKRCFCNPPYSKVEKFLKKAWFEIERGNTDFVVFLVFANTDTKWFHNYIYNKSEIRFIKGRLKFIDLEGKFNNSAMRPSMIVILRKRLEGGLNPLVVPTNS